jgi:predicted AAA+ superfamily ATPase
MEDSLKSQPDKEVSKLSLFDIGDESTGLSIAAVPVHASLTEEHLVGLNSDQGSMVMGISEYLKGKSKPFFLVQGGAGTGKSFSINRALLGIDPKHVIAAAPSHFAKMCSKIS